jgi:hypothetical protein
MLGLRSRTMEYQKSTLFLMPESPQAAPISALESFSANQISQPQLNGETPILNAPGKQHDSASLELAPNKVHIRGLDNLTTKDIRTFATEHYVENAPEHIEWIDDTSANLVYESEEVALEALKALVQCEITEIASVSSLQMFAARPFTDHPNTSLEVRRAVVGDRKAPRARDRSRFYLLNPQHDPAERRKRGGGGGGRRYRDRDDGGYRSQRYDDREQENRLKGDEAAGFDASLYDDDADALARRSARNHPGSPSDSDSGGRRVRFRGTAGKELFPGSTGERGSGRLRDRSASPLRNDDRSGSRDSYNQGRRSGPRKPSAAAASDNRLRAQRIKADMRASAPKELFPQKDQRSGVFDAADETADLFANTMPVPFVDGSADRQTSTQPNSKWDIITGYNIRGASKAPTSQGFSIKGAASGGQVKELFPAHFGDNAGKELFGIEGRGRRRQKAEDLFY